MYDLFLLHLMNKGLIDEQLVLMFNDHTCLMMIIKHRRQSLSLVSDWAPDAGLMCMYIWVVHMHMIHLLIHILC